MLIAILEAHTGNHFMADAGSHFEIRCWAPLWKLILPDTVTLFKSKWLKTLFVLHRYHLGEFFKDKKLIPLCPFECIHAEQGSTAWRMKRKAALCSHWKPASNPWKRCVSSQQDTNMVQRWGEALPYWPSSSLHAKLWKCLFSHLVKIHLLHDWEAVRVIYNPQAGLEYELNCLSHWGW